MTGSFKGAQVWKGIIRAGVRRYGADPVRYRQVEDLLRARGVSVDRATIKRWGLRYSPALAAACHRRQRWGRGSWRPGEPYLKVKGQWCSR